MEKLLNRLQIIENALALGDEEIVALQADKLPPEASELSDLIKQKAYGQ